MADPDTPHHASLPSDLPAHHRSAPSPWIAKYLSGTPKTGPVADIACGSGRHLRLASALGYAVIGIDRDLSGLEDLRSHPQINLIEADLEAGNPFPLAKGSCGAVIVANYLWRPILPDIVAAVRSDGLLIYETFAIGNERFGKPSNPDFLLRPGELMESVAGRLVPMAFEHVTEGGQPTAGGCADQIGTGAAASPLRVRQRIVAVGPDHIWLNDPPNLSSGP